MAHTHKLYLLFFFCSLLSGCFFNDSKTNSKSLYVLQLISNNKAISSIRKSIKRVGNKIIAEELSLKENQEFFLGKEQQGLTVYYLNNMTEIGVKDIISSLDKLFQKKSIVAPSMATISHDVDFFGDGEDELVIKIIDQNTELANLNNTMKEMAHALDNTYKKQHNEHLYDRALSERYSYTPHISLGRIRAHSIKDEIKDSTQKEIVLERIKQRIKKACLEIVEEALKKESTRITLEKLILFSLAKRDVIKEYPLNGD